MLELAEALPKGVARPDGTAEKIERDGQIRLWWDGTRDLEEMFAAGALPVKDLHDVFRSMVGADDERHARIDEAVRQAAT
ncbi:MAG: hypothetical protein WB771_14405 [Solirubrobacterales bacterium]